MYFVAFAAVVVGLVVYSAYAFLCTLPHTSLSLSLSLSHTHTHTHIGAGLNENSNLIANVRTTKSATRVLFGSYSV